MLVRGNDQPLKELARRELLIPTTPEDQVKLGDDWWTISEKYEGRIKRMLMEHAQQFYLAAFPDLSGLTKAQCAKEFSDLDADHSPAFRLPEGTVTAFDFERRSVRVHDKKQVVKNLSMELVTEKSPMEN